MWRTSNLGSGSPPDPNDAILLVDHEQEILDVYAGFLHGYAVTCARTGAEALSHISNHVRFATIFTAVLLPDMSGLEVLRAVRSLDLDTPVVIVTSDHTVDTAIQALEQGALRYLIKPVDETTMRDVAADGVRLHRIATLKREALRHLGAWDRLAMAGTGRDNTFTRGMAGLWMAYQPIFRADTGALYAHEALLRTSEHAVPNPGAFFDLAERLGRVHDLGRRIRAEVASDMSHRAATTPVFVNLHPKDLLDAGLYAFESPLTKHAASIVLEITERMALPDIGDLRARIASLRAMGFHVAIDDLGAGYSGLNSFALLQPDIVKLDMALVRDVDKEPIKRRLVVSMVALCKELGTLVIAEGLETEAERAVLREVGVDLFQGFLTGRPSERPA